MSSEVEPAGSIDTLQRLTEESSSVRTEAERALLIMFLRNDWFTKAGNLIDTQEVSLKHAFTEVRQAKETIFIFLYCGCEYSNISSGVKSYFNVRLNGM